MKTKNQKILTKEQEDEIVAQLNVLIDHVDTEHAHAAADDLLCESLKLLGHGRIVTAYEKISKWYA